MSDLGVLLFNTKQPGRDWATLKGSPRIWVGEGLANEEVHEDIFLHRRDHIDQDTLIDENDRERSTQIGNIVVSK